MKKVKSTLFRSSGTRKMFNNDLIMLHRPHSPAQLGRQYTGYAFGSSAGLTASAAGFASAGLAWAAGFAPSGFPSPDFASAASSATTFFFTGSRGINFFFGLGNSN